MSMKTLVDIQLDMSELYEAVKAGTMEVPTAAELANIAGKYLKAEQLKLAREIFMNHRRTVDPAMLSNDNAQMRALTNAVVEQ
jgi:hypothetical protein